MPKLELWQPIKPFVMGQGFGIENTMPDMVEKYKAIGLKGHNGYDLQAYHGKPVRAAHAGKIVLAGPDGSNGYMVVVRTLEKFDYKDGQAYFKTLYGHLLKEIPVTVGQIVKVGDVIGLADNSGFSFGDHLHFGLKPEEVGEGESMWYNLEPSNGYYGAIDPTPYINNRPAEDFELVIKNETLQVTILTKIINLLKEMISAKFK